MNTTNYKQYDTRWAKLPYRYNPDNIGNNGCGEVSVCNSIIEMVSQMNQTPATMVDYCRQFACSDGTYHSGIPKMLEHYGCTEVMEHPHFASLWRELEKGNRIAIYLMDSTPAGSKGVHWTSGGHFVASVAYKCENGQHWVYMKDSNSISELRNGWITYEGNIRGACPKVWSGKLNGSPAPPQPTPTPTGKIAVDGVGGYETVKRLQEFLGLSDPDGLIGRQRRSLQKYYPAFTAVSFGTSGGSNTITALQKWLGLSDPDGIMGKNTTSALQRRLRDYGYFDNPQESIDGIFGAKSMRALQTALNNDFKDKTKPTPPTPPTPTPTKDTKVIDVSYVQTSVDWAKVKVDGVQGAIIRCGFRHGEGGALDEDDMFMSHIKGASAVGLPVGIYFFTEAVNASEGKEEAQYAIKLWQKSGIPIWYPIGVDTENVYWEGGGKGRANSDMLSKAKRTEAIKAFCEEIKAQGYTPMIYASLNWFDDCLDMSQLPYDVWCAQYYSKCEYKGDVVMWQYTSEGKVNGIPKVVDLNHCYIEPKKVNPPQPQPTPSKMPTDIFNDFAESPAKMGQACGSETGGYSGKAGDQTGKELLICNYEWESSGAYNWHSVFRAKNNDARIVIADACRKACNNDHIGYDTSEPDRKTLYIEAKKVNWQIDKITTDCETTCSELANVCIACAGLNHLSVNENAYVATLDNFLCRSNDFTKVALDGKTLQPGDILVSEEHVAIIVGSIIRKGEASKRVYDLQMYLDWYTDGAFFKECGQPDYYYGNNTYKYVVAMQTDFFGASEADGTIAQKTLAKMKEVRK